MQKDFVNTYTYLSFSVSLRNNSKALYILMYSIVHVADDFVVFVPVKLSHLPTR